MAGEDEIVPARREGILGESGRVKYTGLFKMIVGVLTTFHTQ